MDNTKVKMINLKSYTKYVRLSKIEKEFIDGIETKLPNNLLTSLDSGNLNQESYLQMYKLVQMYQVFLLTHDRNYIKNNSKINGILEIINKNDYQNIVCMPEEAIKKIDTNIFGSAIIFSEYGNKKIEMKKSINIIFTFFPMKKYLLSLIKKIKIIKKVNEINIYWVVGKSPKENLDMMINKMYNKKYFIELINKNVIQSINETMVTASLPSFCGGIENKKVKQNKKPIDLIFNPRNY